MNVVDRFLKYVSYDTMSDPDSTTVPSTAKQLILAQALVEEMKELGLDNPHVDAYGVVYGWIPANCTKTLPAVGFIAHMDTSPDMSGKDVKPQIIKAYDGSVITLNEALHITMGPEEFPGLLDHLGEDLIVTDGTTLLGADDKAGVASIMSMADQVIHSDIEHGLICIAFTPDEEIGAGSDHFDIKKFKADYAYTVDGGSVNNIDYENFNAASAELHFHGKSIHPGSAKAKMINASLLAMEFHSLLPRFEDPACTEGYEGFHHLHHIQGGCEDAQTQYIIRNHQEAIFERQKQDFYHAVTFMNQKYGEGTVELTMSDSYANMRQIIEKDMRIVDDVKEIIQSMGLVPSSVPIRGGTDGARLTYMGLPCPNVGTGGYNYHGKYEYASIQEMGLSVELLVRIIKNL